MPVTVYKDASYQLQGLINQIERGAIGLPDIQRPFVWSNARVRDLFDSMYKGFPVGYLLFWATGAEAGTKKIGENDKQAAPTLLIVDGQQRLTSLFAVMTGTKIVREDYSKARIRVAFKPSEERFEVADAAIDRDPEFIPDIAEVFQGGFLTYVNSFIQRLEAHRQEPISDEEKNRIADNLDRLRDLQNYPFQAIELDQSVNDEQVADVFVRINSEGVKLSTQDFILTLMSVYWEEGRIQLENFCRDAKHPSLDGKPSAFNHFIQPSPDELLITALGLAFRRGRLQPIYSILRGKDLETGTYDNDRRKAQFEKLAIAQNQVLDLNNWHEFLKCLQVAGFKSERMICSDKALMFSYLFWLIGKIDFKVPTPKLRQMMARWWFMIHTTGRYTGSAESAVEFDLNKIKKLDRGDTEGFCALIDDLVDQNFTEDYWNITFNARIDSASAKTPRLSAYWAALNILDAEMLFSDLKVSQMLDPLVTPIKDMERHHLFPRAHLTKLGITEQYRRNQIANMAFVDWTENLEISDRAPAEYWDEMTSSMPQAKLDRQMYLHALPQNWDQLNYDDFLKLRRRLIAEVTREGFESLNMDGQRDSSMSVMDRIQLGESEKQEFKESARWSFYSENKRKSEHIIVKTISGFLNRSGGSLFIGIKDDCSVVGLDSDLATLSRSNRDGYELFLSQLISNAISGNANSYCKVVFHELEGKDVCEVIVGQSSSAVFTASQSDGKTLTDFWVREGNRTVQYFGENQVQYISDHWT